MQRIVLKLKTKKKRTKTRKKKKVWSLDSGSIDVVHGNNL